MKRVLDNILEKVLIALMAIMTLNVLWQVFSRYVLNAPSSFTDELARYLLIWIGMLGAAYATGKRMHLAISLIPSKWMNLYRERILGKVAAFLVGLFALLVLVIGGGRLVYLTYYLEQKSPALEISLAYIYMVLPISGVLIIIYSISHFNNVVSHTEYSIK
ncbi:TRAP transporter small permease [Zhouia amylolytica]|uniref:TRAP transporter small permease n=1 Tax=Zhouia amylolytica TaxID=376730 RepID=UPI0020CBFDAA|nr:TRAP transporter small permease [Zhouia amylolytica]